MWYTKEQCASIPAFFFWICTSCCSSFTRCTLLDFPEFMARSSSSSLSAWLRMLTTLPCSSVTSPCLLSSSVCALSKSLRRVLSSFFCSSIVWFAAFSFSPAGAQLLSHGQMQDLRTDKETACTDAVFSGKVGAHGRSAALSAVP